MNKQAEVIYLAGLLAILGTELAIAELAVCQTCPTNIGKIATTTANRICEQSSMQISINGLQRNDKANDILNYTDTIASEQSASDAAQASFWWAAEQFDPFQGKLVEDWNASAQKRQIDLTGSYGLH